MKLRTMVKLLDGIETVSAWQHVTGEEYDQIREDLKLMLGDLKAVLPVINQLDGTLERVMYIPSRNISTVRVETRGDED